MEPKPVENIRVGYMIYWLTGSAHHWAECLITVEYPCLKDSTVFKNMLKWLFQALDREKPLEIFIFWGWAEA